MRRWLYVGLLLVLLWPTLTLSVATGQTGLAGSFFWEERAFAMNYPLVWGLPTPISDTQYVIALNASDVDSLAPSDVVLTIEYLPAASLTIEDTGNTFIDFRNGFSDFARAYAQTEGLSLTQTIEETDFGYIASTGYRSDLNIKVALVLAAEDAFALRLLDPNGVVTTEDFTRVLSTIVLGEAALAPPEIVDGNAPQTLLPDEPIIGTITDAAYEQAYVFVAAPGQYATVSMVAADSDLDPYLVLYADRRPIASNDDVVILMEGIGDYDSLVGNVELPPARYYTVVATRYSGFGNYTLTLTLTDTPDVSKWLGDIPVIGVIDPGQAVSSTLDDVTQIEAWRFVGEAGQIVTIDLIAAADSSLDPNVSLFDAQGTYLGGNNDLLSGDSLNAQLVDIELPADGEYVVVASRYAQTVGEYELTVTLE